MRRSLRGSNFPIGSADEIRRVISGGTCQKRESYNTTQFHFTDAELPFANARFMNGLMNPVTARLVARGVNEPLATVLFPASEIIPTYRR